jgi:hypothetical protein
MMVDGEEQRSGVSSMGPALFFRMKITRCRNGPTGGFKTDLSGALLIQGTEDKVYNVFRKVANADA